MVAAIVIAYHPQEDILIKNLRSFAEAVDKVLIWRNSPEEIVIPADLERRVLFMGYGCNDYMARPLNVALKWCSDNGYDFLLTMDQDSEWKNAKYFISRAKDTSETNIAVFAPYVIGQYSKPERDYDAESVITSGSLINVSIASILGGFREDYKIYWVDGEYCYWARANGYRIMVFHDCELSHRFGRQTKTIFGFSTSNYSPIVYYFLIRNMLWMRREFPKGISTKTILYTLLYNIRGILFGEKEKLSKIHNINKAIFHGLFSRILKRIPIK